MNLLKFKSFFANISSPSSSRKLKLLPILLLGLLPTPIFSLLLQIIIRVYLYNGSIERPWIFLIAAFMPIAPLTYIPLLLLVYPLEINDGPGKNPVNPTIVIPIIGVLISIFINNKIFKIIVVLISIIITNIITYINTCDQTLECNKKDIKGIVKVIIHSCIELLSVKILLFIYGILSIIPFPPLKLITFALSFVPIFVIEIIVFVVLHIIMNIINNMNICNYCSKII